MSLSQSKNAGSSGEEYRLGSDREFWAGVVAVAVFSLFLIWLVFGGTP